MILTHNIRLFFIGLLVIASFLFINPAVIHAACITADFAGGSGTELDPWQIATPAQLANLSTCTGPTHSDKYYILNNNIDLNVSPYNTGAGWTPIGTGTGTGRFFGHVAGGGHTISGLYINRNGTYQGLFGSAVGALSNIGVIDVNINTTDTSSASYVGALAGRNYGFITDSYSTGIISVDGWIAGGLVGENANGGTISHSYSSVNISSIAVRLGGLVGQNFGAITDSYATGTVSSTSNQIGGLVGITFTTGSITNSYATGDVSGDTSVGGLVGYNERPISNSYATGNVVATSGPGGLVGANGSSITNSYARGNSTATGGWYAGGLVGSSSAGNSITNSYSTGLVTSPFSGGGLIGTGTTSVTSSYWDTQTSGFATSPSGGVGRTTLQMKDQATFVGWNFNTEWNIDGINNDGYPYLRWEDYTDIVPPMVTSLSPNTNAQNVSVSSLLVITFNEDVSVGNIPGTYITIYNADGNSVFESIESISGQISVSGNEVTITPATDFDDSSTYYVFIDNGAIEDSSANYFAGIADENTWRFTTEDLTPPTLVALSPADNATGVVFNPTLEMTFNEPVVFDNGTIEVVRAHDHQLIALIPVSGGDINTTLSVLFGEILDPSTEYYVIVSETAIADVSGNNFEGILNGVLWTFTTRNVNDPVLTYPTNNSAHQSLIEIDYEIFESHLANSLQILFTGDETITINLVGVAVGQHSFTLDTNNITASIAVASSSQNTIPDGVYDVTLQHKDLLDSVILSTIATNVRIDTIAPTLQSFEPANGAVDVSLTASLSLVFDELVGWVSGDVVIYRASDGTVFETIPAGGGPVSGSGTNTLVINPFNDFAEATEYYVLIDNGVIRDLANNSYVGISDSAVWRFTTETLPVIPQQSVRRSSGGQASPAMLAQLGIQTQSNETNNQTQIQKLLAQVQELQKILEQLQQEQGVAESVTIPDDACLADLWKQGMRGECIGRVQTKLGVTPVSGYFGPRTLSAVRKFQTENNLDIDGVVGSQTWSALFKN